MPQSGLSRYQAMACIAYFVVIGAAFVLWWATGFTDDSPLVVPLHLRICRSEMGIIVALVAACRATESPRVRRSLNLTALS